MNFKDGVTLALASLGAVLGVMKYLARDRRSTLVERSSSFHCIVAPGGTIGDVIARWFYCGKTRGLG